MLNSAIRHGQVVKVIERRPRALIATIRLPPDSLHSKSSAVITRDGAQVYIATKQGLGVADTTTNVIVANIPLGPVSAVDFGPSRNYVQLQTGKVTSLDGAQAPQVADPNYLPPGPDQPIVHDTDQSAWVINNNNQIQSDGPRPDKYQNTLLYVPFPVMGFTSQITAFALVGNRNAAS